MKFLGILKNSNHEQPHAKKERSPGYSLLHHNVRKPTP